MRKRLYIAGLILLLIFMTGCGKSTAARWQEQYDLGMKYLEAGEYEEAIVAFTAAIEIDPKNAEAYACRGQTYILSGETEENLSFALADFEQALELDETNAVSYYLAIADVYIRQGDYDKALEILNEGLEKTDQNQRIAAKIEELGSENVLDSSGNIRKTSSYDASGNLIWYHEFTYDEKGRKTSVTAYDGTGNQIEELEITYQNNLPSAGYSYNNENGDIIKQFYTYDDSGNTVRMDEYREDDVLSRYFIYEYDADGNAVREEQYNGNGNLQSVNIREFNEQGKVVRQEDYGVAPDQTLSLSDYHLREYDSLGNQIKYSHYDSDNQLLGYQTWEYGENGNLIRYSQYDSNGQLEWYYLYTYDETGRRIESEEYDSAGNLIRTRKQ